MHDGDAHAPLLRRGRVGRGAHQGTHNLKGVAKGGAAQGQRFLEIFSGYGVGHRLGLLQRDAQRRAGDLVALRAHHERLRRSVHGRDGLHGLHAQQSAQVAVVGAGRAAALDVAQHGDAHVLAQSLLQHFFHVPAGDGVALAVARPFGDDDHAVAPAHLSPLLQLLAHAQFPVVHVGRRLRDEHPVRAGGHGRHERQIAAVATHDLDDEAALVAGGGAGDGVGGVDDAMQGGVGSSGDVGAKHIVVD